MISVPEFDQEFSARHEFVFEDSNFLRAAYPSIRFSDIPEAWVCLIDTYLRKMQDPTSIRSISQVYGLIVLDVGSVSEHDKKVLRVLEDGIKMLDVDLYDQLKAGKGISLH